MSSVTTSSSSCCYSSPSPSQTSLTATRDLRASIWAANPQLLKMESKAHLSTFNQYKEDIFRSIKQQESIYLASFQSFSYQNEVDFDLRLLLIDYLITKIEYFSLSQTTLFLTVNLIDRYCSTRQLKKVHLKLLGLTCLWIASKFNDNKHKVLQLKDLIESGNHNKDSELEFSTLLLTKKLFVEMESHVLENLEWLISCPTHDLFVDYYLNKTYTTPQFYDQIMRSDTEKHYVDFLRSGALFLCELSLMFPSITLKYKPSIVAYITLIILNSCYSLEFLNHLIMPPTDGSEVELFNLILECFHYRFPPAFHAKYFNQDSETYSSKKRKHSLSTHIPTLDDKHIGGMPTSVHGNFNLTPIYSSIIKYIKIVEFRRNSSQVPNFNTNGYFKDSRTISPNPDLFNPLIGNSVNKVRSSQNAVSNTPPISSLSPPGYMNSAKIPSSASSSIASPYTAPGMDVTSVTSPSVSPSPSPLPYPSSSTSMNNHGRGGYHLNSNNQNHHHGHSLSSVSSLSLNNRQKSSIQNVNSISSSSSSIFSKLSNSSMASPISSVGYSPAVEMSSRQLPNFTQLNSGRSIRYASSSSISSNTQYHHPYNNSGNNASSTNECFQHSSHNNQTNNNVIDTTATTATPNEGYSSFNNNNSNNSLPTVSNRLYSSKSYGAIPANHNRFSSTTQPIPKLPPLSSHEQYLTNQNNTTNNYYGNNTFSSLNNNVSRSSSAYTPKSSGLGRSSSVFAPLSSTTSSVFDPSNVIGSNKISRSSSIYDPKSTNKYLKKQTSQPIFQKSSSQNQNPPNFLHDYYLQQSRQDKLLNKSSLTSMSSSTTLSATSLSTRPIQKKKKKIKVGSLS